MHVRLVIYLIAQRFGINQSTSKDRLRLQNLIYKLQQFGAQFGYGYFKHHGRPCSTNLVWDVYAVLTSEAEKWKAEAESYSFNEHTLTKLKEFVTAC